MTIIFSYNRPDMLLSLLNELQGDIVVIDDGSTFDPDPFLDHCDFYRSAHRGKRGFWMQWRDALEICKESGDEWFLFLQDDVQNVQLDKIQSATKGLDYYAFNIMNRGSDRGWTQVDRFPITLNGIKCETTRYVDCIFSTNRKTLDKIGWKVDPISPLRFVIPTISSGVGQQFSQRFAKNDILMYKPIKSLATHSDHESKMHPEERRINPLISV